MNQDQNHPKQDNPKNLPPLINDFVITFSTINGSGSATANTTLLRALFRMGIPVSGRNTFPSNIQGQPTWYSIRLSKDGFLARREKDDIVIAMNPATFMRDQQSLLPGGVLFYADDIKVEEAREDIFLYPMPVKKLIKDTDIAPNLREYIANMVYVGVVSQMLGIKMEQIYEALDFHFKGKKKAIDSNLNIIHSAAQWAEKNLVKRDRYQVEKMSGTDGYIMTDGNTAGALGAIFGGVQFTAWYPITPASTLAETLIEFLPEFRQDPETGKDTYVVIQAEDELAAIGMAVGAGWSGLRSMTSTSGPGISLMSEYLGLAYFTETPVVVWNVQRTGPSTGLPTRTSQGDLTQAYFNSHGDKDFIILIPGSVTECFEFGWQAFDIAERIQTPVIVLSDLEFGMNIWMTPAFKYPDRPLDRGKVLWEDSLEKFIQDHNGHWGRYWDVDGDGIPYRTVMGNAHPKSAYFTRGTGHDEFARYSEEPEVWERNMDRIKLKFETAKQYLPAPILSPREDPKFGIISMGSSDPAVVEALAEFDKDGVQADYLRIRAIPFSKDVSDFIQRFSSIYVVETNRDGQLLQLLTINFPQFANRLRKVSHLDGLSLTAKWVRETIQNQEQQND